MSLRPKSKLARQMALFGAGLFLALAPPAARADSRGPQTSGSLRITLTIPAHIQDPARLHPCERQLSPAYCEIAGRQWDNVKFVRIASGRSTVDLLIVVPE